MKQEQLMEIFVLVKRVGNLLDDVMDVSRQLAEAVDRQDEVSIRMLVAMRYEPIEKLTAADRALRRSLDALEDGDGQAVRAILNGDDAAARNETEKAMAAQAAANIRTHRRVMEQDRILNQSVTREKSFYRTQT